MLNDRIPSIQRSAFIIQRFLGAGFQLDEPLADGQDRRLGAVVDLQLVEVILDRPPADAENAADDLSSSWHPDTIRVEFDHVYAAVGPVAETAAGLPGCVFP